MRLGRVARVAAAIVVALGGFALVGYAVVHDDSPARGGPGPGGPVTSAPIAITAVRAVDPRHLEITAEVSGPETGCARNLRGSVNEVDGRRTYVTVVYDSPRQQAPGRCARTRTVHVRVAVPDRPGRVIIDSIPDWRWALGTDGVSYRQCTGPFGCEPPPKNHCDPAWLRLAGHSGELPPERSYTNRGCDGTWLVMDIDAVVTGCQPLDGRPPPAGCADAGEHVRWFFRFTERSWWTVVAAGNSAGCTDVHRQVPEFPTRLCAKLPPR